MTRSRTAEHLARRIPDSLAGADYFDEHPTVMFEIDNFLSDEIFDDLARTFPSSHTDYRMHQRGEKKYLENSKQAFWNAIADAPAWRTLYGEFCSAEMIDRLQAFASPHITHRPEHERLPWRLKQPLRRRSGPIGSLARLVHGRWSRSTPRRWWRRLASRHPALFPMPRRSYTAVELGFEFSILTSGDSIPPHTDQVDKLLSMMLYFPDSDQQSKAPLGTEFWRGRDGQDPWTSWKSQQLDDDDAARFYSDHEMYYQVPFHKNRLVGFIKSGISWHGLRPLHLEPNEERRGLVINIYYREPSPRPSLRRRHLTAEATSLSDSSV